MINQVDLFANTSFHLSMYYRSSHDLLPEMIDFILTVREEGGRDTHGWMWELSLN